MFKPENVTAPKLASPHGDDAGDVVVGNVTEPDEAIPEILAYDNSPSQTTKATAKLPRQRRKQQQKAPASSDDDTANTSRSGIQAVKDRPKPTPNQFVYRPQPARAYQPETGGSIRLHAIRGNSDPSRADFRLVQKYTQQQKLVDMIARRRAREFQRQSLDRKFMRDIEDTNRHVERAMSREIANRSKQNKVQGQGSTRVSGPPKHRTQHEDAIMAGLMED